MAEDTLILSFDVGTTSTKACLYKIGDAIQLINSVMKEYPIHLSDGGKAEQNPEDWVNALVFTAGKILEETGTTSSSVKGISFSSQMQGLVLTGKDGGPLRPAMSYMDQRAVKEKEKFGKGLAIDGIPLLKLLKSIMITGIAPTSVKDPIWKYHWVREHEPDLFRKVKYWFDVKDYLIYRLTGNAVCTKDSACATFLFDNRKGKQKWSLPLCRVYGIIPEHLPKIIDSHEIAGYLTEEIARKTGLNPETPVFGGGGDASMIGLGAGAVRDNQAHIYMGTSGWVSVVTDKRTLDIGRKIASITCAIPGRYHYFSEQETSGKCLEWVKNHLALDEIGIYLEKKSVADNPESMYKNLFEYLNVVINQTPAGSNGILFTPWLHGNRSPFEDPNARGIFFNISLTNGKRDMIRGVVEGLAYNTLWMLESIEKKVKCRGAIRFAGGGALSGIAAQILADVTGREIEVPANPHNAGALGGAIVASLGLGLVASFRDIPDKIPAEKIYSPDRKNSVI